MREGGYLVGAECLRGMKGLEIREKPGSYVSVNTLDAVFTWVADCHMTAPLPSASTFYVWSLVPPESEPHSALEPKHQI